MTSRRAHAAIAAILVSVVAGGACQGPLPSAEGPAPTVSRAPTITAAPIATEHVEPADVAITVEPFVTVAGGPLAITAPDDGTGRLFVAAQDGRIWVVDGDATVLPEPMVNLGPRLRSGGEQGLLGLAVHPEFPTDPRVFVNYTNVAGDTIIASLTLDPTNPNRLDEASHRELLFVDQPYPNHNGGGVLFGPDGYLYLSLGDGGGGGDPQGNGQRLDTLLAKILRVDVGGPDATSFTVPSDNPFAGGVDAPEIWHYGLRNPWRLSFDRATGDLWIGDVGQGQREEIDIARAGASGLNFGWNVMEGTTCYNASECDSEGLTMPVSDYGRDLGCTVIGGYVYRGERYPFLAGTYLFTDYCSGRIFAIDAASDEYSPPTEAGLAEGRISSFGEDVSGELYITTLEGAIFRVVAEDR